MSKFNDQTVPAIEMDGSGFIVRPYGAAYPQREAFRVEGSAEAAEHAAQHIALRIMVRCHEVEGGVLTLASDLEKTGLDAALRIAQQLRAMRQRAIATAERVAGDWAEGR